MSRAPGRRSLWELEGPLTALTLRSQAELTGHPGDGTGGMIFSVLVPQTVGDGRRVTSAFAGS